MKTVRSRVLQDSRVQSRISVQIYCRLKIDEYERRVLMLDVSQGGAFLTATFPYGQDKILDRGSKISITIETEHLEKPLTLKGTIRRSNSAMSEFGTVGQFGIEFEDPPLALLRLISALSKNNRKQVRVFTQMECQFISDDKGYKAHVLNLFQEGAIFSSRFLPAPQNKILIVFESDLLKSPLTAKGTVTRNVTSDNEETGQFEVAFENPSDELIRFISALSAERNENEDELSRKKYEHVA